MAVPSRSAAGHRLPAGSLEYIKHRVRRSTTTSFCHCKFYSPSSLRTIPGGSPPVPLHDADPCPAEKLVTLASPPAAGDGRICRHPRCDGHSHSSLGLLSGVSALAAATPLRRSSGLEMLHVDRGGGSAVPGFAGDEHRPAGIGLLVQRTVW